MHTHHTLELLHGLQNVMGAYLQQQSRQLYTHRRCITGYKVLREQNLQHLSSQHIHAEAESIRHSGSHTVNEQQQSRYAYKLSYHGYMS